MADWWRVYNLPSDLRFLLQFILALSVISGPNKPKDSNSFLKAQLTQIMTVYNVSSELSLVQPRAEILGSFSDPLCMIHSLPHFYFIHMLPYPSYILLPPKSPPRPNKNQLDSITTAISTYCEAPMSDVNAALKGTLVEEWGKVRRIYSDAGHTIKSCSLELLRKMAEMQHIFEYV
jgi:hypothetical protein